VSYATVMVSLALNQSNEARLTVAGELADRFGARIIGIAAAALSPPLYFTDGEGASKLLDAEQAALKKGIAALEAQFRGALPERANEIEWRCSLEMPARYIAQQARAADLIITGAKEPASFADPFAAADPSDLLMSAGRPLLVVPAALDWWDMRSALVAWKDGPEARRAVADALPLLRLAKEVNVAEVLENGADRSEALARVQDVVAWLSRHGVVATARVPKDGCNGNAAVQLELVASSVGAGLVVAGGYAHSRFREWILGGVTEHLLESPTRCALLAR
jgi:nucleotide-binding universal stress UspA family protein